MARIALITGGMGGLGEAICMKMAALGYQVVTTHSPGNTKAPEWLGSMEQQGYKFRAYPCDVADYDSAQQCVAQIVEDMGPIDVLVNNAGYGHEGILEESPLAEPVSRSIDYA
jgi:acetoacetyl-CoA reductase